MTTVRRRLFTLASVVSMVLCIATVVLWEWTRGSAYYAPPTGWEYFRRFGFKWRVVGVQWPGESIYATNAPTLWYVAIVMLSAIAPLLWTWRVAYPALSRTIMHHRPRSPLTELRCRQCGYDLRATRDRCPECGSPVGANPANAPRT